MSTSATSPAGLPAVEKSPADRAGRPRGDRSAPGAALGSQPRRGSSRFRPANRLRVTAEAPRASDRWSAVPLSSRLVLTMSLLLAIGLALGATITLTVLQATLLAQVDRGLYTLAWEMDETEISSLTAAPSSTLPSNFYVSVQSLDGVTSSLYDQRSSGSAGLPLLPDPPDPSEVVEEPLLRNVPGTSADGWRALTVPWLDRDTREILGTLTVALPLQSTNWAVERTTTALLATSGLITVVGIIAALFMVRRALRSLRRIESTAGAIAKGDLSRRLPDMPVTTEVGSLARSLNVMLAQIEHAFAEREGSERRMRRFISDASHELRTPLATIRGYAELYRMGGVPDDQLPGVVGRMESEATRMGALVDDLVHLARLDEGRRLEFTPVNLVEIARDAVQDLGAVAPDRPAGVVGTDGTPGSRIDAPREVLVTADENRMRQLVSNLVGNVLAHTPDGVPLEIAVGTTPLDRDAAGDAARDRHAEPAAVIEVRDHGPGIAPDQRTRVFERFHRLDASRNRALGGSGLGLAIVAAIVAAHRGTVSAEETPGGGTTMRILLPLTTPDAEESAPRG